MGSVPSLRYSHCVSLYAAYRTDLDPAHLSERCPSSPVRGPGWLSGWRLTFAGGERDHGSLADALDAGLTIGLSPALGEELPGALATVVQEPGSSVFVMLFDMSPADKAALEIWEGERYRTVKVRVETLEGSVMAWTFVYDGYEGGLPTASYLGLLSDAAEEAGAPDDYVRELRNRPCRSNPS
jgi:hypothetical protein